MNLNSRNPWRRSGLVILVLILGLTGCSSGGGAYKRSIRARRGVVGGKAAALELQLGPHGGAKGTWTPVNGRTLERTMTWTVERPTTCDAPPTELRVAYSGVGYHGVSRSGTIVRTADGLERTSVAEREDGTRVESLMTRSASGATLVVRHLRADGSTALLLELAAAPGGPAVGTLSRYDEAGEVIEVIEISRDPAGRFLWRRPRAATRVLLRGAF